MNVCRSRNAALGFAAALTLASTGALAQGVTGAAVTGTVKAEAGAPLEGAAVQLRNTATGETFNAVTGKGGSYFLDNVPAGGPYVLTVTKDSQTAIAGDIQLALGERRTVDLNMRQSFGEEIKVVAHNDKLADRSRSGPSTTVKSSTITELPLQGRNFTDLLKTDPRVSGGSFAGQNDRYNNIQIDGGANNDLFGLGGSTPGSQIGAKPLSIEAIQEFQIQVAPFDVRLGNFAGGLVNAVTKSGTNEFHGSLFGYEQNKVLARDLSAYPLLDYNVTQYGATLGGPIVKDKAHFFIATDLQSKSSAFGSTFNITPGNPNAPGFDNTVVDRFNNILATKYGITNAGNASAPSLGNPDRNLFVKVDTTAIPDSRLELSYNLVSASNDTLLRAPTGIRIPTGPTNAGNLSGGYELSNSGYVINNTTNTVRAKLTTNFDEGRLSNELLGGISIIRDRRAGDINSPLILVNSGGTFNGTPSYLASGSERFSQANALDQNIYQLQDNLTYALGAHRLTAGTSNEFLSLKNVFLQAATGVYSFASLQDFQDNKPSSFQRRIGASTLQDPGTAAFNVSQLGVYLQDEWTVAEHFTLTPGIRVDVPFLSQANTNQTVLANSPLGIDTSKVPSGNALLSPRAGFNWDVSGDSETVVRGGAGVFSGRPPYVFVSNAYAINGLSQTQLTCVGAGNVPALNPDPNAQPSACLNGPPPGAPVDAGEIDYFDPNTKYPQNFRLAFGADKRLPFGLTFSADFLYTRDVNAFYTTDENVTDLGANGEGREVYGTFAQGKDSKGNSTFNANSQRVDTKYVDNAIKVFNKDGGHVTTASFQLTKAFGRRFSLSGAYTYSRSLDRMSFTSSQGFSNYQFSPVDGTLDNRNVRPSAFDRPHKITVSGNALLPYGFILGVIYVGQSGLPYTWTVNGDVNGDGINGNDTPFIPGDASQITLANSKDFTALDQFINSQDCLKSARGGLLNRGACRNPWQDTLDTRLSWRSPEFAGGSHIEAQWDVFNLLNLLNQDWGHFDQVTPFETASGSFLSAVGYDAANKRPIYSFRAPTSIINPLYSPTSSRWRMQFGAKYTF
jgi:hypothetical protein